MYMILKWKDNNKKLTALKTPNNSIKLFLEPNEAKDHINQQKTPDNMRVVSIEPCISC